MLPCRYILALNAAPNSTAAPGLYGSFVTEDQMLWAGDLTLNYNAEAPFYGALQANRPWLLDGYVATINDIIPTATDLARRQYPHCEPGAMYFPGHILPHGVLTSDDM
jgi:alpha-L-fucosidase 2